jgi:5-methylcytosine-specific restriction endonuclease McrA
MNTKEFTLKATELLQGVNGLSLDELIAVRKNYKKEKHSQFDGSFKDANELAFWYLEQFKKQDGKCCYCDSSIVIIKKLIDHKLLGVRRVKGEGVRGPKLEIERIDSIENIYKPENCLLACYYCNNDKSNVFTSKDYKDFIAPSKKQYFDHLFKKII